MRAMKSPAFQFYPSDWLSSRAVRLMDAEQRGWYIQLLAESWQSRPQASLPNDDALLLRLADANNGSPNFDSRWQFVISQFKVKGELLINDRLAHEKRKQNDYHQQRKEAGAKGAAKRWREPKENKADTAKVSHGSAIVEPVRSHVFANGKPIAKDSSSSSSSSSIPSSTAISTSNEKRGRAQKQRDPRQDHPAIQAVLEAKGSFPLKDTWDVVIKVVGDKPNVERMRECWVRWRTKGNSPMNLDWLLDWYVNGIPERHNNGTSERSGYTSNAERRDADFRGYASVVTELRSKGSGAVDETVRRKPIPSQ